MQIKKVNASVAIILNSNKEILLQKKDSKYLYFPCKWCMFGGGIELREDPLKALIRELEEEINIYVKNLVFFKKQDYQDNSQQTIRKGIQYIYTCIFDGKISDIKLSEGAGFAFFSSKELEKIEVVEHDLYVIKEFFSTM